MKTIVLAIVGLLFVFHSSVFGQEIDKTSVKKNEVSVSTNNLEFSNLSLKYSRLISDNVWLKVGLINLGYDLYKYDPRKGSFRYTDTKINAGLLIGIEKQRSLSDRLKLTAGLNAQMIYNYSNHKTEDPTVPVGERANEVFKYTPGIGLGLGLFYQIDQNFLLGVELNPSVNYFFEKSNSYYNDQWYKAHGFYFSLSNNNGFLTLKYRF